MHRTGWGGVYTALLIAVPLLMGGCTGSGDAFTAETAKIFFETESVSDGGAGQLYNQTIVFGSEGAAALPDRFEVEAGSLPPGIQLLPDRQDLDLDGLPDPEAPLTGYARLIGFPRTQGSYAFRIKAISTGALRPPLAQQADEQPTVATAQDFTLTIGEGSVTVLTPTAAEGTADSAVPAFPVSIDFVNPANPQAFFSWPFLIAGGSGDNLLNVYLPREVELSVFDQSVIDGIHPLSFDTNEGAGSGNKFLNDFSDGGWFVLQAGNEKVQVGGFQSPRGPVGTIDEYDGGAGLDPEWFQRTPGAGGPAINSQRTFGGTEFAGGDTSLGTPAPVQFSDYFDTQFEPTWPDEAVAPLQRRKYPFTADQYQNAFFVTFTPGVDLTPLRYRAIVEAIDRRGTQDKSDDVIDRKAFIVNVRIPDIVIDSVFLPAGQAGVDYVEFANASGGVPPLEFELEWVDGSPDEAATAGDALTKQDFGIEMNGTTGQFFGVPRASGTVDLTVRVFAAVMNPTQSGPAFVPTGTDGEFNGLHPLTNKAGIHKTFAVDFALPTAPRVANANLAPGKDGNAYPGAGLVGTGGVAKLVPYPVGFAGDYPASTVRRAYSWDANYVRDESYGADAGTIDPDRALPRDLVLDGDIDSPTNGQISGVANDRGFHPVTIEQTDAYIGDAANPDLSAFRQNNQQSYALSISPDSAIYMRGLTATESAAGEPSGLLDKSNQQGSARMVPMFYAASLLTVETGGTPQWYDSMPPQVDLVPIMLANGGSDEHNRKSIPSISGFWPAESGSETDWGYDYTDVAWKHLQQEMMWAQVPNATQRRVFLWGEGQIKTWSGTSGHYGNRYAVYKDSGRRGVLVLDPTSGDFWMPAVLNNNSSSDGDQFGAEAVIGMRQTTSDNYSNYGNGYWKAYYYYRDSRPGREANTEGLGTYIITPSSSANTGGGWYTSVMGRTATSIAMSADGTWCATAMPGGSEQKILLWRTDKQPIPGSIVAQSYATPLSGFDKNGNALTDSAVVLDLGGESASGVSINSDQRYLLPDSLMFVKGGLLFLNATQLDRVFGVSLSDGSLSSIDLDTRSAVTTSAGTSSGSISSSRGQFTPDQDYKRGVLATQANGTQFAFAGNKPADGDEGPTRVAFVAGSMYQHGFFSDLGTQDRDGMYNQASGNRYLLWMDVDSGGGFDLSAAELKDLTGSDPDIYGDLMTPGRFGEELDFVAMSEDGEYVAAVRDYDDATLSSTFSSSSGFTFATNSYSSSASYQPNDDLLLVSASGNDLDSGTSGTQNVLYVGSHSFSSNGGDPSSMPGYATGRGYLNGRYRRINGLHFAPDGESLVFNYAGHNSRNPKYYGFSGHGWALNPQQTGTFGFGTQMVVRMQYRNSGAINYSSSSPLSNAIDGLSGIGGVGPTSGDFGDTSSSEQLIWSSFVSEDGNFLYYISDQLTGRNFMVGLNISDAKIGDHDPWVPFSPHANTVGFEQFDVNSFSYESRFFAVPPGTTNAVTGRDASGLVFVTASDSSAGAASSTDLEVYVFDANIGSDLQVLTSDITDGSANAINYLYVSADGNFLAGQRSQTSAKSRTSRVTLTTNTDLFVVDNVHAVVGTGAAPNGYIVSEGLSHGSSVAFVGEGTATGPQAIVFSAGASSGGNGSWDDRTLRLSLLAEGAAVTVLDSAASHYAVLAGSRKLDDDPTTGN